MTPTRPQCHRCRARSSILWYPLTFGDRTIYLCDSCIIEFGRWIAGGRPDQ